MLRGMLWLQHTGEIDKRGVDQRCKDENEIGRGNDGDQHRGFINAVKGKHIEKHSIEQL